MRSAGWTRERLGMVSSAQREERHGPERTDPKALMSLLSNAHASPHALQYRESRSRVDTRPSLASSPSIVPFNRRN